MMLRKNRNTHRKDEARTSRRKQVRKSPQKGKDRNETVARQMPPVMVRSGKYSSRSKSKRKTRQPKLKRRYDISLSKAGSQGVEMRLPSVPVVHPGWRVLSFLVAAGMLAVLYYLMTSPLFRVKLVQVQGVLRLGVDEINRTLDVYNETIFEIHPEQLEERLNEAYSELTNVSIQVNLPNQVLVEVNERVPMVAWIMENETLWIDGNGFIFTPRGEAEKMVSIYADVSPPMTVVDPNEEEENPPIEELTQAFMPKGYIDAVFVLKTQAPEGTTLIYDGHYGFGWADPQGWLVYFGKNINDIDSKLHVYRAVVEKIKKEGTSPSLINVAYLHAPYYR